VVQPGANLGLGSCELEGTGLSAIAIAIQRGMKNLTAVEERKSPFIFSWRSDNSEYCLYEKEWAKSGIYFRF
jgi:hypothetical protein